MGLVEHTVFFQFPNVFLCNYPCAFSLVPSEIRLQKPRIGHCPPDDTILKGWLPGSSGSCVIRLAKAFKKIYISKRQRKIYNYTFSNVYL
jgi:hypothetical protein